jgi:hypothetical protein
MQSAGRPGVLPPPHPTRSGAAAGFPGVVGLLRSMDVGPDGLEATARRLIAETIEPLTK